MAYFDASFIRYLISQYDIYAKDNPAGWWCIKSCDLSSCR